MYNHERTNINAKEPPRRGEIYYISQRPVQDHEQFAGRPGIIVSNDTINKYSPVINVVFLTTQHKPDQPTHVTIRGTGRLGTALCEQVASVSINKLGHYIATLTKEELAQLDIAISVALGLNSPTANAADVLSGMQQNQRELQLANDKIEALQSELQSKKRDLAAADGKYSILREMYQELAAARQTS